MTTKGELTIYLVTGATGNTGSVVAKSLLTAGESVRVIGRQEGTLRPFTALGAEVAVGSLEDSNFVMQSLAGVKAIYAIIPPNLMTDNFSAYAARVGEALTAAIAANGIEFVVNVSGVGADLSSGTGQIASLHAQEQRLVRLTETNVLHLRLGALMESFSAGAIPMIESMKMFGSSLKPDVPMPLVAAKDIGDYAAKRLLNLDFSGHIVQPLLGQRDVTFSEATEILGRAMGIKDLPYVCFPETDARASLQAAGLNEDATTLYIEMNNAFNSGIIVYPPRDAENTTPTSFESYCEMTLN